MIETLPLRDTSTGIVHILRGFTGITAYTLCNDKLSFYTPPGSMARTRVTCAHCKQRSMK